MDSRSNVVTLLGALATRVVKSGEPLWYAGSTEDLPPQIEKAIEDYVDQSYTKSLGVIPLRKPQQVESAPATPAVEERAHQGQIVGALIIEQIESEIPRDILAPRLDLVYEHSARALSNAIDHNSLFLMPVWRTIGKSAWVVQARTLPKTVTIAAAIVLVLLGLIVIPWDFDMRAKGALEPVVKKEVFAPTPSTVESVLKDHGDTVQAGDPLVVLHNPDLALKITEVQGQLEAAMEELQGVLARLNDASNRMSDQERLQAEGLRGKLQITVEYARQQLALLQKRQDELTVRSPIAGRVITWDVKRLLQNRPVDTGQVLMTVAAENTDYEIKLYMPERRARHVTRHRERIKAANPDDDLAVDYILMTEPGKTYYGKVIDIGAATESHDEQGSIVPIRVKPDEPITTGRPGATVTADVHCGKAPLGWSLLHEAWEWLEGNVFF
jgi:multidrug efflux pump subunit AcrA (membrane-fusion protein)